MDRTVDRAINRAVHRTGTVNRVVNRGPNRAVYVNRGITSEREVNATVHWSVNRSAVNRSVQGSES
jgi:hypothetical protein